MSNGRTNTLDIFPNPASNHLNLHFEAICTGEAVVTLYDAEGRSVLFNSFFVSEGLNQIVLPVPSLPSGAYWVRLEHCRSVQSKPVVLRRF